LQSAFDDLDRTIDAGAKAAGFGEQDLHGKRDAIKGNGL
jgi:hypothetical protein